MNAGNDMRKATMPIPYVIALMIGVVVVVILAYWFITSSTKGSTVGGEAECTARKLEYCALKSLDNLAKVQEVCKTLDQDVAKAKEKDPSIDSPEEYLKNKFCSLVK